MLDNKFFLHCNIRFAAGFSALNGIARRIDRWISISGERLIDTKNDRYPLLA